MIQPIPTSDPNMLFSEATGEICLDLPSPYIPHAATGLLHLPRFIAKIRKHLAGTLPKSYQRNFCKGFDRFLCMHLGVDPQQVIEIVKKYPQNCPELDAELLALFPRDLRVAKWNRELVQKGMSEMGRESLLKSLTAMGCPERAADIISFADMIDFDEQRIK